MERAAWTDARIDDLVAGIEREFALLRAEMRELRGELRGEMRELRAEMHADMSALRADFGGLQRQLAQIGWGMVGVLVTAMVALVVAVG